MEIAPNPLPFFLAFFLLLPLPPVLKILGIGVLLGGFALFLVR
jgi:hypothetical protein